MKTFDPIRVQVLINGIETNGTLRAYLTSTNCFSADTYSLTFALGSYASGDTAFWSSVSHPYVQVNAVSQVFGVTSLIAGRADSIHIDPINQTVVAEGRDLSSSMVDSFRQQDFVNQTASEIVSTIAQYHGLLPVVAPTTGNIGRYYGDGYTKLSLGQYSKLQSDWDLLVQLARQIGFDLFVADTSLYFQPSDVSSYPSLVQVLDVQRLRIERNLNIMGDTVAKVQSWNSQSMSAYQSDGPSALSQSDSNLSVSSTPPFLFSGSNYTSQQVSDSAERYTAELTRLNTVLHIEMPWDLSLVPRAIVQLDGTASALDTTYKIDSVERSYSSTRGSTQAIRAVPI